MPNYIEIEEALGGQADVLPDRRTFETGFIRTTLES